LQVLVSLSVGRDARKGSSSSLCDRFDPHSGSPATDTVAAITDAIPPADYSAIRNCRKAKALQIHIPRHSVFTVNAAAAVCRRA